MTEFPQDLRHYCRNPRCRSKLPSPVSNPREAFCTRGCYESFHLKRCRVCEQPLEAKYRKIKNGGDRTKFVRVQNSAQTCGSAECKRRWRERDGTGRFSALKQAYGYQGSQKSNPRKETPVPQALFCAIQTPKWRQVAGPPLTPNQFHCATVAMPVLAPKTGLYRPLVASGVCTLSCRMSATDFLPSQTWCGRHRSLA